jgi:hypothetical protein
MLMMVWVLARAEVIEVQYSVGFVVYFMALGTSSMLMMILGLSEC